MCNLSQGILQVGVEKGRTEGRAEGRAEGEEKKARSMVLKMIAQNHSIEYIADFVEVPVEQVQAWISETEEQTEN